MITSVELTQKLISLPSYVSDTQDETLVTDFLFDFLAEALPSMTVERQYLESSKRCNLILRGKNRPKLFVLGHIDTVQPKAGWETDPLESIVKDNKLYGLGASDMKGSLAAFLSALMQEQQALNIDNLMILMYVDEEYDFKGIKRFLSDKPVESLQPKFTLSLDGELAVATGCRGLIELSLTVKGKSGHAANPANGVNAITKTVQALEVLSSELVGFEDTILGPTTTNIAALQGGVIQETEGKIAWLRDGNIIPDTAEVIFEVRPATPQVNADFVLQKIRSELAKQDLQLAGCSVRHDIQPWLPAYEKSSFDMLKNAYRQAEVPFRTSDRKLQGYIDAQMVAEKIPAPIYIIGTGGENKHGANECASLENIEQATRLYREILRRTLQ